MELIATLCSHKMCVVTPRSLIYIDYIINRIKRKKKSKKKPSMLQTQKPKEVLLFPRISRVDFPRKMSNENVVRVAKKISISVMILEQIAN